MAAQDGPQAGKVVAPQARKTNNTRQAENATSDGGVSKNPIVDAGKQSLSAAIVGARFVTLGVEESIAELQKSPAAQIPAAAVTGVGRFVENVLQQRGSASMSSEPESNLKQLVSPAKPVRDASRAATKKSEDNSPHK